MSHNAAARRRNQHRAKRQGKKVRQLRKAAGKHRTRHPRTAHRYWIAAQGWGIQNDKTPVLAFYGKTNPYPFSNHALVPTTYRGTQFRTSEHAYLATQAKAYGMMDLAHIWTRGEGRHHAYGRWFDASNPKDVKSWSTKAFRPFRNNARNPARQHWLGKRTQVMYGICLAKFMGDQAAQRALLETGHQYLVEASPYDADWGIGCSLTTQQLIKGLQQRRTDWGKNQLGRVLMAVRNALRDKRRARRSLKARTIRYKARKQAEMEASVYGLDKAKSRPTRLSMHISRGS